MDKIFKDAKIKIDKMLRKAQAAMDFLMSYSWAILVVLIAMAALSYFGFFSPDNFLASKCKLPTGFDCVDFSLDGENNLIILILRNRLGFDAQSVAVYLKGCNILVGPQIDSLPNGAQAYFIIPCAEGTLIRGFKYASDLNVTYVNWDIGTTHKIQGIIIGRVD